MANNTKIQWTDHTLNFWTGCVKVSPGCKYCYMYRDQERYGKDPSEVLKVSDKTVKKVLKGASDGDKIFVNSWSDFFIDSADEWRDGAWEIIKAHPQLTFQILTKRPERISECLPKDWGEGYQNVWLGVSIESQRQISRAELLCEIPSRVRFLSVEPIIGEVDLTNIFLSYFRSISWVIIGGESGNEVGRYKYRLAKIHWFNELVETCNLHCVPVFVKQLGTYISKVRGLSDRHGGNIDEFPKNLRVRQFPTL